MEVNSDSTVEQVEADLKLCEEFLERHRTQSPVNFSSGINDSVSSSIHPLLEQETQQNGANSSPRYRSMFKLSFKQKNLNNSKQQQEQQQYQQQQLQQQDDLTSNIFRTQHQQISQNYPDKQQQQQNKRQFQQDQRTPRNDRIKELLMKRFGSKSSKQKAAGENTDQGKEYLLSPQTLEKMMTNLQVQEDLNWHPFDPENLKGEQTMGDLSQDEYADSGSPPPSTCSQTFGMNQSMNWDASQGSGFTMDEKSQSNIKSDDSHLHRYTEFQHAVQSRYEKDQSDSLGTSRTTQQKTQSPATKFRQSIDDMQSLVSQKQQQLNYLQQQIRDQNTNPNALNSQKMTGQNLMSQQRIDELSKPRVSLWERCEKERQQKKDEELVECSFAPKTGRPPQTKQIESSQNFTTEQRLYHSHDGFSSKIQKMREEKANEELKQCTFKPQTKTAKKRKVDNRPIHERVTDIIRQRKEKLAQNQFCKEFADPNMSFQPKISRKSQKLVAKKEAREREMRFVCDGDYMPLRRTKSEANLFSMEGNCTFAPEINQTSQKIVHQLDLPSNFMERQKVLERQRVDKRRQLQLKMEDRECSFAPKMELDSQFFSRCEYCDPDHDHVKRLSSQDVKNREIQLTAKQQEYFKQFKFKPEINKSSKVIAQPTPLDELVHGQTSKQKKEVLRQKLENRALKECTFQPNLNKPKIKDASYYPVPRHKQIIAGQNFEDISSRIRRYTDEKEARIANKRNSMSDDDLKECSFTPEISHKPPPKQKGPILVRGLAQFIETKKQGRRQKEEKQQLHDKIFLANPVGNCNKYTVPKPFSLTDPKNFPKTVYKREKTRQVVDAYWMKECTFKPQTNESAKREALNKLLLEDDVQEDAESSVVISF